MRKPATALAAGGDGEGSAGTAAGMLKALPVTPSRLYRGRGRRPTDPVLRALLDTRPRPLFNPGERLVSLWAPKAACTVVLVWHLSRIGALRAAFDYHAWPHRYRTDVMERGRLQRDSLNHFQPKDYVVVRFVRDPFKRAVSAYRHALRYHLMPKPGGFPVNLIRRHRLDADRGYSFVTFLETVAEWPFRALDIHLRPQMHPIESLLTPDVVVNADAGSLTDQINALETALGLTPTDFPALSWLHHDARRRHARSGDSMARLERGEAAERVFRCADTKGEWPSYDAFRSPRAEALVRAVYACDVAAYGLVPPEA